MKHHTFTMGLVPLALAFALGACGKKPVQAPAAPTPPAAAREAAPTVDPSAAENARRAEEEARRLAAALAERILFDYDRFDIRADQQPIMEAKAAALRAKPETRLTIAGHADERGSIEYNLALGMRRANAARDFLGVYGLDLSRFEIVSFGEERPFVHGAGESVWSQNRRAEFVVR